MSKRSSITAGLLSIVICSGASWLMSFSTAAQAQQQTANSKEEWTPEKLAQERWLLHELHQQQLAALSAAARQQLAADIVVQDVNDISVIQNNNLTSARRSDSAAAFAAPGLTPRPG